MAGLFRNRGRFGAQFARGNAAVENPEVTEEESFEMAGVAKDKIVTLPWEVTFTVARGTPVFYCHLADRSRFAQEGVVTPVNVATGESKIPLGTTGKVFFKVKETAKTVKVTSKDDVVRKYDLKPAFMGFIVGDKGYLPDGKVVPADTALDLIRAEAEAFDPEGAEKLFGKPKGKKD